MQHLICTPVSCSKVSAKLGVCTPCTAQTKRWNECAKSQTRTAVGPGGRAADGRTDTSRPGRSLRPRAWLHSSSPAVSDSLRCSLARSRSPSVSESNDELADSDSLIFCATDRSVAGVDIDVDVGADTGLDTGIDINVDIVVAVQI